MDGPLALVGLTLGGPDTREAVEPVVRLILADPGTSRLPVETVSRLWARRSAASRAERLKSQFDDLQGAAPADWALGLVDAVAAELQSTGRAPALASFRALRYWHPFAADAVRRIEAAGIREAVLLPLTPHAGPATADTCVAAFRAAAAAAGDPFTYSIVDPWYGHPAWLDVLAARVRTALAAFPDALGEGAAVLCAAPGLPARVLRRAETYVSQLEATVAGLKARLPASLSVELVHTPFLRASAGPGVAVYDRIRALPKEGRAAALAVPLAQPGDDLVTAFELGLQAGDRARAAGLTVYRRLPPFDVEPALVRALARIVRDHLARRPGGTRLD